MTGRCWYAHHPHLRPQPKVGFPFRTRSSRQQAVTPAAQARLTSLAVPLPAPDFGRNVAMRCRSSSGSEAQPAEMPPPLPPPGTCDGWQLPLASDGGLPLAALQLPPPPSFLLTLFLALRLIAPTNGDGISRSESGGSLCQSSPPLGTIAALSRRHEIPSKRGVAVGWTMPDAAMRAKRAKRPSDGGCRRQ